MEQKLDCILLIDDDEPTNFLNEIIIESADCTKQIKSVQTGEEALIYLANTDRNETISYPDLIFLDINMPAMNGWEFLERYRALKKEFKEETKIVMLTTSLFPEDAALAKEISEVSAFENKPLTEEKLSAIIKKLFEGRNFKMKTA